MTATKHSALPWSKVEHSWEQTSIYDKEKKFVGTLTVSDDCTEETQDEFEERNDANAAFIVEACNSFYLQKAAVAELCAVLRLAKAEINLIETDRSSETALEAIDAALSKHKGA